MADTVVVVGVVGSCGVGVEKRPIHPRITRDTVVAAVAVVVAVVCGSRLPGPLGEWVGLMTVFIEPLIPEGVAGTGATVVKNWFSNAADACLEPAVAPPV